MNPQERETLNRLLTQLGSVRLEQKDSDAEALIRETCSRQPDAHYLLVQRTLLLEKALQDAQARIGAMQAELEQSRSTPRASFLDANSWGNAPISGTPARNPVQPAIQPAASPAAVAPSTWGSGLLGNVATTAAGVVAGSFLFQGIEHLMGRHGSSSNGLADGLGHLNPVTENTVTNNYYGTGPNADFDAAASPDNSDPTDGNDWV